MYFSKGARLNVNNGQLHVYDQYLFMSNSPKLSPIYANKSC